MATVPINPGWGVLLAVVEGSLANRGGHFRGWCSSPPIVAEACSRSSRGGSSTIVIVVRVAEIARLSSMVFAAGVFRGFLWPFLAEALVGAGLRRSRLWLAACFRGWSLAIPSPGRCECFSAAVPAVVCRFLCQGWSLAYSWGRSLRVLFSTIIDSGRLFPVSPGSPTPFLAVVGGAAPCLSWFGLAARSLWCRSSPSFLG